MILKRIEILFIALLSFIICYLLIYNFLFEITLLEYIYLQLIMTILNFLFEKQKLKILKS
jgi:hypothetical protein